MSAVMPDWSVLPEELLHLISQKLDNGFDGVHARSVCTTWRSTIPFPSCLLRSRYDLPTFPQYPLENKGFFTLEKIPLVLFRVKSPPPPSPCEYFLGRISRAEAEDDPHMKLPSPLQCSVKMNIRGVDRTMLNVVDCQVFPLGHQCRMFSWNLEEWRKIYYRGVAFMEGGGRGEFIALLNFTKYLFLLRSDDMMWIELKKFSDDSFEDIVPFRGRFYGTLVNKDLFVMDPYSPDVTPLMPLQPLNSVKYLVPSGNDDELFLVEKILPPTGVLDLSRFACRVSKLDEEAGKWVEVIDVGGRVLFIGYPGNVSCSAKELPDGCGLSGDSLLFTGSPGNVTYSYKYGVNTGREEDDLNLWRFSGENPVTTFNTSYVVALQVER